MRILRAELSNVRQFRHLSIDLSAPLTLIVGPNGSGKSTLQEALRVAMFQCAKDVRDSLISVYDPHSTPTAKIWFSRGPGEPRIEFSRDLTSSAGRWTEGGTTVRQKGKALEKIQESLPISAAVIIAAALFANAGDLDPPKGPIEPTMHDLQEIYDLVQQSSPCGGCTWEYKHFDNLPGEQFLAIPGAGVLHGIWIKNTLNSGFDGVVVVVDGPPGSGTIIGEFGSKEIAAGQFRTQFFELNVVFEQGLYIGRQEYNPDITILYRSANP